MPERLRAGFFYEGHLKHGQTVNTDALAQVEKHMHELCRLQHDLQRIDVTPEQALDVFCDNPFKQHFIHRAQQQGETSISIYKLASFVDLCEGPHIRNLRPFSSKTIALTSTSQAEFDWSGREEMKPDNWDTHTPLTRTYGICFPSKQMFRHWKRDVEEREKYNHSAVGKSLSIFMQHDTSPGAPFFLPHGVRLLHRLTDLIRRQFRIRGYEEVMTPLVFSQKLWETSGHWDHYRDDMYRVMGFDEKSSGNGGNDDDDDDEYLRGLKPMNCPAHCLIFKHTKRSHHDLPLRLGEFSALHRNEASGALAGLTRVRQFHQDDAHIFCTEEQIQQEVAGCLDFVRTVYDACGFTYSLTFSTRPDEFTGDISTWDRAEAQLRACLDAAHIDFDINEGDGAFYGPKIDVYLEDRMGRRHQSATIQLDFQLPQRFDLNFTDAAMMQQRPVIIHRAILGSLERMTAVLLEHTRGHLPLWCSPRQVAVLSVSSASRAAAAAVHRQLVSDGLHAETFLEDTTIARKVRAAEQLKFNAIIVVGDEEAKTGKFSVRWRDHDKRLAPLSPALQRILRDDRECLQATTHQTTSGDSDDNQFTLADISAAIQRRMHAMG
ncbi:threonyl-tRNA synthetase 1 [Salpingoeca rosetta]|uniref:threonine--tRNA ligase n=1 Tax=Salpingoeca rosetta (strain ATCC 50818 / BSB-021) TaxID=946362 RepID=F2UTF5_SALR5|nr:threonyl-tRNA synthetase 1 [Salpingoeca rosetta]EGD82837.1 threonyl-tRNA synthetase 1 [Salpingoeca rosetta]|eukprot:XP_004987550.1 threonyl-tRNA synthetase 1 [Salpingoeca rosetta]